MPPDLMYKTCSEDPSQSTDSALDFLMYEF